MEFRIDDVVRVAHLEQHHPVGDFASVGCERAFREIVVDKAPRGGLRIGVRAQVEHLAYEVPIVVHDLEQAIVAVVQRRAHRRAVLRDEAGRVPEEIDIERPDDARRRADMREPMVFMDALRREDVALCRPEGVFHLAARRKLVRFPKLLGCQYIATFARTRNAKHAQRMRPFASDGN